MIREATGEKLLMRGPFAFPGINTAVLHKSSSISLNSRRICLRAQSNHHLSPDLSRCASVCGTVRPVVFHVLQGSRREREKKRDVEGESSKGNVNRASTHSL